MATQFAFENLRQKNFYGGESVRGRRKVRRPIATKRPMHLVLKSSSAVGRSSMLRRSTAGFVSALLPRLSRRFGVRIFQFSNNGNHLHLLIQARDRNGFRGFVRTLSALVARDVTGARKGHPLSKHFWDFIPFTRIVEWGRSFKRALNYVIQNQLEVVRAVPYHPRETPVPWHLPGEAG